jgi:hypothetical protein
VHGLRQDGRRIHRDKLGAHDLAKGRQCRATTLNLQLESPSYLSPRSSPRPEDGGWSEPSRRTPLRAAGGVEVGHRPVRARRGRHECSGLIQVLRPEVVGDSTLRPEAKVRLARKQKLGFVVLEDGSWILLKS